MSHGIDRHGQIDRNSDLYLQVSRVKQDQKLAERLAFETRKNARKMRSLLCVECIFYNSHLSTPCSVAPTG